jgi:Rrf2 family protein
VIYGSSSEYAIRALSTLATWPDEAVVMLEDLIAGTDLPRDFMAKILQKLVHKGLLRSVRGRNGGFALARPAFEVTIADIVKALEGESVFNRCVLGLADCNDQAACPQHDLFKPIRQRLNDYLSTTTLADMAASLRAKLASQPRRTAAGAGPQPIESATTRPD